jgi:aminoglycoside 3-N-acetyltransferase
MINRESIFMALSDLGLTPNDIVMIHGDAGPSAQIEYRSGENQLTKFIKTLCSYFSNGTVLVPSFSYSSTKNEIFDPLLTKSEVGLFSESFRNITDVVRSPHPIFSFSIYGKNKDLFLNTSLIDCFGDNTIFDEFYKANGKILFIGCSLDRATFVHYIEQQLNVPYRYFKNFQGCVIINGIKRDVITRYFVRNLDIDATVDLSLLKSTALSEKNLFQSNLGRFPIECISARDFYFCAKKLYASNQYSLIKQRFINA